MANTKEIKQIEYVGEGEICKFKEILNITSSKKIFLVTGKGSYAISGAQEYFQGIKDTIDIFQFKDFSSLPLYEDVLRGVEIYKKFDPDLVVAVGGGSVIDMAKAINILACQDNLNSDYVTGAEKIKYSGKKLVAIPTTSGSGSEATHFAVIYKDGVKYSLSNEFILPTFAIVDPALSRSVPRSIATACALDAISQAIESFWSNESTKESKLYAKGAIELILKNIIPALEDQNHSAIEAMSLAAHQAGKAINISKTTACHAMSYGLTHRFKVPHGIAASIFLPSVYLYNSKVDLDSCKDSRGLEYTKSIFSDLNNLFSCQDSEQTAKVLKDLLTSFDVINLSDFGVKESDLSFLTKQVNIERLNNNPRLISETDIYSFYKENL